MNIVSGRPPPQSSVHFKLLDGLLDCEAILVLLLLDGPLSFHPLMVDLPLEPSFILFLEHVAIVALFALALEVGLALALEDDAPGFLLISHPINIINVFEHSLSHTSSILSCATFTMSFFSRRLPSFSWSQSHSCSSGRRCALQ